MAQKGKRYADHRLLLALACGASVEQAARQAGVSESTAYRRLADAAFRKELQDLRGDMARRTAGALTAAASEAVRTPLELMRAQSKGNGRLGGGPVGAGDRHEGARGRGAGGAAGRPGGAAGRPGRLGPWPLSHSPRAPPTAEGSDP